jgi:hypothetical protein
VTVVWWVRVIDNSEREISLRAAVLHASVPFFVFGLLLSFFQLSSLAIGRLRKAFAREDRIIFWIVGG